MRRYIMTGITQTNCQISCNIWKRVYEATQPCAKQFSQTPPKQEVQYSSVLPTTF